MAHKFAIGQKNAIDSILKNGPGVAVEEAE